jgi:hypothetical protein
VPDVTSTIKLKAVDDGLINSVNKASGAFTNLTLTTTALSFGFKGLQKVSESSFASMVVGAENAGKLSGALGKLTDVNSKALNTFSALSNITFAGSQFLTAVKGVQDATQTFTRLPQTLELLRSSGVTTKPIEDFYTLTDAVKGSEASLESFAVNAVQSLGRFEQAAARAGTILRSSVNFDEFGNAQRASQKEQLDNAFQVQRVVNTELNNAVSSTEALIGQYEVLSSGFTKSQDSQQVLSAGLKLAGIGKAGGVATDPGETLRLLGKTLNAYQLSSQEAGKAAAILNSIVENGITTVPELSQGFGQTATTARAAGIAFTDLAASTAVLTTQGINTATALTGLQRVAGSVIQKTPDAQKALDKLSLNGKKIRFDQAEVQAKGFTQALIDLNKAAGGNVKTLQEIFPEEVAFRTVLALLAQDGQKLQGVLGSVSATTSKSLDDVFKTATGDRVSRFEQIANRFQELIIKIAQSVAPVFEPGLAVLERIAKFFSDLPDPVKDAIGQFIVFQITSRATVSAVGILFQTLLTLASSYVQVRLVSLALSGQLGREIGVIKDLVVQRKGLLAATLQLFGIDQRWRLASEQTTKVLEKQNVVSRTLQAGRSKAVELIGSNVSGLKGEDAKVAGKQVIEKGKNALGNFTSTARNIGLGALEATGIVAAPQILGADGKPISSTGLQRIKQEVAGIGGAIASGLDSVKSKVKPKVEEVQQVVSSAILGADGKPLPIKQAASNVKEQAEQAFKTAVPDITAGKRQSALGAPEILNGIIATDSQYESLAQKTTEAFDREEKLTEQFKLQQENLKLAREQAAKLAEEAKKATLEAANSVTEFNPDRQESQKLIDTAIQKQEASKAADDVVRNLESDVDSTEREKVKAQSEALDSQNKLLERQEVLKGQYAVVSQKEALARRLNIAAITLEEKATLAKTRADELERIAAYSPEDIILQTQAKQARAAATSLEAKAASVKARAETEAAAATQLATAIDQKAMLAQQGLAATRIFGVQVVYSTTGPLGAINTLLATEITLTNLSTASTIALTTAKTGLKIAAKLLGGAFALIPITLGAITKAASELTGSQLLGKIAGGFETLVSKMGGIGKLKASDVFNVLSGGLKGLGAAISSGLGTLMGTLGPLAPLLGVLALGAAVFREELFGLRKAANEAADGFGEILKKDQELAKQFGRERRLIEFKTELKPNTSAAQVETRLEELRLSGDLTTGQFNSLRKTLAEVGTQGQLTGEQLDKFKSQLDAVKQGATGEPEKGVMDNIGDFFKGIPGFIGGGIDNVFNYNPAVQLVAQGSSLLRGEGFTNVAQQREADSLVQNLSRMSQTSEAIGNASIVTQKQVSDFKKGKGLTSKINEKIAKGENLTASDFEEQNAIVAEQKARNENLISGLDKQIEKQREVASQIKNPELKASFEARLQLVINERNALEKRNEALKQGDEQTKKYYLETLPALRRELSKNTNFQESLANAQTSFNQQFQLDANGKPTPFLKDANTLKQDGQRLMGEVMENYQAGMFEQLQEPTLPGQKLFAGAGVAEGEVARRLREIRDNTINIDGQEKFRYSVTDRIAATQQVVEFEQTASKQRAELLKNEVEKTKLSLKQKVISEEEADDKIAALNVKSIQETLAQKEIEIKEYEKFPVRKAQLEREAAAIRIQLEQAVADENNRILNINRNRRQEAFNVEIEDLKAQQAQRTLSAENAEEQIAQIQIKAARDRLNNLIEDYEKAGKKSFDIEQKIAIARAQLKQQEAQEETRLLNLKREQTQNQYNIEIEQIKALQSERAISSQDAEQRIAQQQIQQTKDRLNNLIEDYNKSGGTSVELEQKIAQTRASLRQQEAQEVERLFNIDQERQKRLIANSTQLQTLILQRQSNGLENRTKDLESGQQLSNSVNQLQNIIQEQSVSQLENQLKLTGDIEKRAQLESQIAETKFKSLELTQQQERVSLSVQTQVNRLQLERESIQLRIQKIENQRQASELNLELIKANREKRTPEEIEQIELQIKANQQQGELLDEQEVRLERNKLQQQQTADNSRKELDIKQQIARTNAQIETSLIKQKELQASIEKQIQNIQFASQALQLSGEIQNNQLENSIKLYDQQKSFIDAAQNAAKGRLDFITGELDIALQLTTNEDEKRKLAQTIEAIKIRALEQQIAMEKQVLELNLQQQKAQLEQEVIRNRVARSQANADFTQAQADYQKLVADPNATPEQLRAAALNAQAKSEKIFSLDYESLFLQNKSKNQDKLADIQRQTLNQQSELRFDQGLVAFAQTLPEGERERVLEQIRKKSLAKGLGVREEYLGQVQGAFNDSTVNRYFGGRPLSLEPINDYFASVVTSRLNPNVPQLGVNLPGYEEFRKNQVSRLQEFGYQLPIMDSRQLTNLANQELKSAVDNLNKLVDKKLSTPSTLNITVPITNQFSNADKRSADTVTQQIRSTLYDLAQELSKK